MKFIALLLIVAGLSGCYARDPEKSGKEGTLMPSFRLLLADSTTYLNTEKIAAGKPSVLFYFGPHCPYSHAQMENIIKNIDMLKDVNFYLLTTATFPEMKGFYDEYELGSYPNIKVGVDYTNFFGDYFEARGVPYLAIYGKDRKLNETFIGKVYGRQIRDVAEE